MGDVLTKGPARLRQGTVLILTVLCILLLTACGGGGSKPFAKGEGTPGPSGKTVPPIALIEASGLPEVKLAQLKDALAIAAGKRDMAIIDSKLDNTTMSLTGSFHIAPEDSAVKLSYSWTLTDPAGTVLHTISAEEVVPGSPARDPWLQVTPAVLQRVAAYTAESLSSRLSQLGYATEVGGMPPPLDTYARAGPDADKDIDLETLYGPGKAPTALAAVQAPAGREVARKSAPADEKALATVELKTGDSKVTVTAARSDKASNKVTAAKSNKASDKATAAKSDKASNKVIATAAKSDKASNKVTATAAKSDKASNKVTATAAKSDKASKVTATAARSGKASNKVSATAAKSDTASIKRRKQINAVAVLPVNGAPGPGNAELTKAMRQTLADAGWPVLKRPRGDALTIVGSVKLGPRRAKSQNVALAWTVKTPDGRTLGTVKQANDVPAGSLEAGFGENALFATQAAAGGIYDLVKKYR